MAQIVDARGQACPQPVILARRALQQADAVSVIVDNATACENLERMARSMGRPVRVEERPEGTYVHIGEAADSASPQVSPQPAAAGPVPGAGPTVVFVPADTVGRGPEELGAILVRTFFHVLTEASPCPDVVVFMNSGVRLVAEGSPVLNDLKLLADRGVQILACGTCLDFFDLKARVAVGTVSNMYTIVETLLSAGRLVTV